MSRPDDEPASSTDTTAASAPASTKPRVIDPRRAAKKWALKTIEAALRELDKSGDLTTDPEVGELCAVVGGYVGRAVPVAPGVPGALLTWMEQTDRQLARIERATVPGLAALLKLLGERLDRQEGNADHLHDDVMAMREWMRIPRPGCYPRNQRRKVARLRARKG